MAYRFCHGGDRRSKEYYKNDDGGYAMTQKQLADQLGTSKHNVTLITSIMNSDEEDIKALISGGKYGGVRRAYDEVKMRQKIRKSGVTNLIDLIGEVDTEELFRILGYIYKVIDSGEEDLIERLKTEDATTLHKELRHRIMERIKSRRSSLQLQS